MGQVCCGEEDTKRESDRDRKRREALEEYHADPNSRRTLADVDDGPNSAAAFGPGGDLVYSQRALPHEASSVASSSLPPSPPRQVVQQSSGTGIVGLEPLETTTTGGMGSGQMSTASSIGGPGPSSSPLSGSPSAGTKSRNSNEPASPPVANHASPNAMSPGDPEAAPRFLAHVNGANSHAVARSIFECWCIFLSEIEKADDAAILGTADGFGDGTNNRGALVGGSASYGDADVQSTATSTRVEKWATLHASEAVTHESVDELAKQFMNYLKTDLKSRGWGGSFEFSLQGFDVTGVLTVTVKTVRRSGDPHTFELMMNYHAVSLL